ncbi:MAG: hypothetical protein IIB16_08010 [Chloroflexi bacterium]|nr:hypothetical protein [Chloroflexota bacterium]
MAVATAAGYGVVVAVGVSGSGDTGGTGVLVAVAAGSGVAVAITGVSVEVDTGGSNVAVGFVVGSGVDGLVGGTGAAGGEVSGEGTANDVRSRAALGVPTPLLSIAGGGTCAHPMITNAIAATASVMTGRRFSSLFNPITVATI